MQISREQKTNPDDAEILIAPASKQQTFRDC